MAIRFGVSPIAWVNDDMPQLGAGTALTTILADARDIGFEGAELGGIFPRDAEVLKPLMAGYGLDLVGGWFSGNLLVHDVEAEIAAAADHLALLKAMGSTVFVHAETSNAIHGQMGTPLADTPRLDSAGWKLFGDRLTRFADYVAGQGLRCSRMLESTCLMSRWPHRAMVVSSSLRMMSSDIVTPACPMAPRP